MSAIKRGDLWERLRDGGLVEGDMPQAGNAQVPWFVRLMLGIAGWIGAMFLFGFVGVGFAFVMKSSAALFVVGAVACAVAVAIFRAAPKNDFIAQFGLALSFAGQLMLAYAVAQWLDRSVIGIALFVTLLQAVLFFLVPNFVHRLWSAWAGILAASYVLLGAGLYALSPAVTTAAFVGLALQEFKLARHGALVRAGVYGFALAAVQTAVLHGNLGSFMMFGQVHQWFSLGETGVWLGRLASLAVLLWAVMLLLQREGVSMSSGQGRVSLIGALILGLVSIKAPGVGPAVAILIVGYANADRVLVGFGIFALLAYLSHYYYALETSLLVKSGLLVAAGVALLLVRLAMRPWWPDKPIRKEEISHA